MKLTLSNPQISILSVIEEIIFLHHWCLKPFMGLHQPTFLIVLSRILMLMVMTPDNQIWSYISQTYLKTCIEIVLCIWVANCGMICPSWYNILRALNHWNRIIKYTSWLLAHNFLLVFGNWSISVLCNYYSISPLIFPSLHIFRKHGLYNQECYICGTTFI